MRLLCVFLAVIACGQEFEVTGAKSWVDTGIDLHPGDVVRIGATGQLQYSGSVRNGPQGLQRGWKDLLRILPYNDAGRGALVGRIGSSDAARPFLIGEQRESRTSIAGRLFLGINQTETERPAGKYAVKVEVVRAPKDASAADSAAPIPAPVISQEAVDRIPRRVVDAENNPGDRVNFLVVGTENQVRRALSTAGWVQVDREVRDAIVRGLFASLSKQAYVTLPMSELLMFNRPQDFGYAQGDPLRVVAARHHFRLWRAPFDVEGRPLWAGAGTHDIGFDTDQRNGKLTHRIDSDTDLEREYIGQSISQSGLVAKLDYVQATDPVKEARTAHGQTFTSDGRTLVIYLKPDTTDFVQKFADVFCSVLKQENPDGGEWGACSQYLEMPGKDDLKLEPLTNAYRVLVVPGILSSCTADTPAYAEGRQYLKNKFHIDAQLLNVPNDSSESNANRIAEFVKQQRASDPRKFILIGYSKGTPDIQEALARDPALREGVAAFVSVAGASGGSPIADVMPSQLDRWVQDFRLGSCQGDLSTGFKSLQQSVRRAFLASYPHPFVPTFSLVAVADLSQTSKALQNAWQILSAFGAKQDGQLTRDDAVIPDAGYLGAAISDHFALALPFDKSGGPVSAAMDKTRYPRSALLESMLRVAVSGLPKPPAP